MQFLAVFHKKHEFLLGKNFFHLIYYLGTAAVLVGFIYSRALLSIGQISIAAIWLLEGNFQTKFQRLRKNKIAILWAGLYLMHIVFLFNTSDFEYAAEDLRIKLPLFLFPVVFSTTDIFTKRELKFVLYLFLLVILSATVTISVNYLLKADEIEDIREASFLISHIRLALMICLSIAVSIYFAGKENGLLRIVLIGLCLWFTAYMIFFAYLTGIIILGFILLFMLIYYIKWRKPGQKVKWIAFLIILTILSIVAGNVFNAVMDYLKYSNKKEVPDLEITANKRPYAQWYKTDGNTIRENGYLVFQNMNAEEIEREWNRRSGLKFSFTDQKNIETRDILMRFLASKGLPKDSTTISSLSELEIKSIESGITNSLYIGKSRIYQRIYKMCWEYDVYTSGGNFNGHSLGIRLEFWKTGFHVFKRHFLTGTGTGDIENEFQEQYKMDKSELAQEWRFRSHNQIISMAATFGIFGLLYFLIVIFYPVWWSGNKFLYLSFALIFFLSIITEDTLETQIGVTFYAFFNSLLYFQGIRESNVISESIT